VSEVADPLSVRREERARGAIGARQWDGMDVLPSLDQKPGIVAGRVGEGDDRPVGRDREAMFDPRRAGNQEIGIARVPEDDPLPAGGALRDGSEPAPERGAGEDEGDDGPERETGETGETGRTMVRSIAEKWKRRSALELWAAARCARAQGNIL